jgi:pyruvate/2-oxoglutarate dehydrogenase complex dihydrolipoamide acyltransferase (E2) component
MSSDRRAEVPVKLPAIGISPVRISAWFAELGDRVYEGDRIVEISAGSATFDVGSPATGRLSARTALRNDELTPGQIIGFVEPEGAD